MTHRGRAPGSRVLYRGTGDLLVNDVASDGRVLLTQRDWRQALEVWRDGDPPEPLEHFDWAVLAGVSDDGTAVLWGESGLGVGGKPQAFLQRAGQAAPIDLGPGRPLALSPDGQQVVVWPSSNRTPIGPSVAPSPSVAPPTRPGR